MQGREPAVGWEGRVVSQGLEDGPFNSSVLVSFFLTLFLLSSLLFCVSVSAPYSPLSGDQPCSPSPQYPTWLCRSQQPQG